MRLQIATLFLVIGFSSQSHALPTFAESGYSASYLGAGTYNGFGVATTTTDDIYFTSGFGGEIYKIDSSGNQTTYATTTNTSMGLTINGDTLFAGNGLGQIVTYDLNAAIPTASSFVSISGTVNDMMFADAASVYAGSIIAATNSGLYAIDENTQVTTTISLGLFNGVEFASDGSLYATTSNGIQHYLTNGVLDYYISTTALDGIAIHEATDDIFLASSSAQSILRFDSTSLTTSTFASTVEFDGGWYPSPLEFSSDGTELLYGVRDGGLWSISGFEGTVAASEPPLLALFGIGLVGVFMTRKKGLSL